MQQSDRETEGLDDVLFPTKALSPANTALQLLVAWFNELLSTRFRLQANEVVGRERAHPLWLPLGVPAHHDNGLMSGTPRPYASGPG